MLDCQHARRKRRLIIVGQHRDGALRNDRANVDIRGHVMDAAPVNAHAIGECAAMRLKAGIEWQQRWVNIDKPTGVALHEVDAKHAHETGQDNQVGHRDINRTRQRSIEIFAHVVVAVIDNAGCDAGCAACG